MLTARIYWRWLKLCTENLDLLVLSLEIYAKNLNLVEMTWKKIDLLGQWFKIVLKTWLCMRYDIQFVLETQICYRYYWQVQKGFVINTEPTEHLSYTQISLKVKLNRFKLWTGQASYKCSTWKGLKQGRVRTDNIAVYMYTEIRNFVSQIYKTYNIVRMYATRSVLMSIGHDTPICRGCTYRWMD